MADFLPINDKDVINIVSTSGIISINLREVNKTLKGAYGNIAKKITQKEQIKSLV